MPTPAEILTGEAGTPMTEVISIPKGRRFEEGEDPEKPAALEPEGPNMFPTFPFVIISGLRLPASRSPDDPELP